MMDIMFNKVLKKTAVLAAMLVVIAQSGFIPPEPANAAGNATLSLGSATLRNGCPASIPIVINSGGENVWAVDTALNVSGAATVNSLSLGSNLPLQACNDPSVPNIMLCGARMPGTGTFNGSGTYGTINVTPEAVGTLSFSFDGGVTKIINESIQDVLGSASGGSFEVAERYNVEVNGQGFCTPDTTPPVISITPRNGANNVSVNSNVTLALSDNRVGVDVSTLTFSVRGVPVDVSGYSASGGTYTPPVPFDLGERVNVTAHVCDFENNCSNYNGDFRTTPPPPPPSCGDRAVDAGEQCDEGYQTASCDRDCSLVECGDGLINDDAGEQCDDGNTADGDGCSSTCKLEAVEFEAPEPVECPVCPTCSTTAPVREAAPEIEEAVLQEAAQVTITESPLQKDTETVALPTTQEAIAEIDPCIVLYGTAGATLDRDGDGLSDRTECYVKTDPENPDTDGDSCFDGEELNRFYTSPLDGQDCSIGDYIDESVVIVDPKPNWIIRTLEVSGTAPIRSVTVGVTAFPAIHKILSPVLSELEKLTDTLRQKVDSESLNATQQYTTAITESVGKLQNLINDAQAFMQDHPEAYGDTANDLDRLSGFIGGGAAAISTEAATAESLLNVLKEYDMESVFVGSVNNLQEIGIGNGTTAGFSLNAGAILDDGVYDLVATAGFADGSTKSSAPVRVTLDSSISVEAPVPQTIDGVSVNNDRIVIESGRPVLSGQSVYGAHVFATWESLVLASSIIADSTEGGFDVQPPQDLERGQNHKVTLYALTETEGRLVRSESVSVDFAVKKGGNYLLIYWIAGILAVLVLAIAVAKRRLKKIDREAPEYRAKENELYNAFGEKHKEGAAPVGGQEEPPADHETKQTEIEAVFKQPTEEAPVENPITCSKCGAPLTEGHQCPTAPAEGQADTENPAS
jgi:cysteine-rich repeat protein